MLTYEYLGIRYVIEIYQQAQNEFYWKVKLHTRQKPNLIYSRTPSASYAEARRWAMTSARDMINEYAPRNNLAYVKTHAPVKLVK